MNQTREIQAFSSQNVGLLLIVAGGVAVVFLILQWLQRRRELNHYRSYRSRYIQQVAQLEVISVMAQQLAAFAKNISTRKILDLYEEGLLTFEEVLQAFKQISPFGKRLDVLATSNILVKRCYEKFLGLQVLFRDDVGGRPVQFEKLSKRDFTDVIKGCYFCSRPNVLTNMQTVRVKLDDTTKEVLSCDICKSELQHSKKVKVLYFVKDGKSIHWSDMPDYRPSEDYWNINKREAIYKTRHLELVHTASSSLISKDKKKE